MPQLCSIRKISDVIERYFIIIIFLRITRIIQQLLPIS